MKVLGIMGSPRLKGNTDLLLDAALQGAAAAGADVEKLNVDKLRIEPCREFYGCLKDGNCVIRDDMDDVYVKLLSADIIIVASPMFFYGLTAQLKALIDRCQALWARRHVLKRPPPDSNRKGAFIAVGATKGSKMFEGSVLTMKYFFREIGVKYGAELLVSGVDKKGDIKKHPVLLTRAYEIGRALVSGPRRGDS